MISKIESLLREKGAITVLFVDSKGNLVVADAETGEVLPDFVEKDHPNHPTEIQVIKTVNGKSEPVLYDKSTRKPIPETGLMSQHQIYFWRYPGSTCECIWSSGKHVVRCRS